MKCSPLFEVRESQGPALGQSSNVLSYPLSHEPRQGDTSQSSNDYPSLYATTDPSPSNPGAPIVPDGFENPFFPAVRSVGSQNSPGGNSYHESTGSRPQSNHPTPSTSSLHNSSSHTSYTSPQNQSISGGSVNSGNPNNNTSQTRQSQDPPLGYIYPGSASWQASLSMAAGGNNSNGGRQQQQLQQSLPDHNLMQPIMHMNPGMSPGPTTGMTPASEMWAADNMTDNNDWMFGWPGQTPQPQ